MIVYRVWPDDAVQGAILEAAFAFEQSVSRVIDDYRARLADPETRHVATERRVEQEMYV